MGLAYTVDTPVKVARYGIASVISIIEDNLIEKMRSYYYAQINEPYHPITHKDDDYRARRITDYLNLINRIVKEQVEKIRSSAFEAGTEITKYFELLPDNHPLKKTYNNMLAQCDTIKKFSLQEFLRKNVTAGAIDVNIMTKLDKINYDAHKQPLENGSDALAAMRGYVNSDLTNSSVVLSAGMNPRLFNYMEKLDALRPGADGTFAKKIIIKVSDYRSALIQGKYLAKKGLWVSEFRIESGLNCGGHAFATDGMLLGPILEEFKSKRDELTNTLFSLYTQAPGSYPFNQPPPIRISVQGGIGLHEEDEFLRQYYGMDSTGWGSPFLLVPEATTVDDETLQLLCDAAEEDVTLSRYSPLGVPFYYLKGTSADKERQARIARGFPGSPCTEKHLISNTEFSDEPLCTASRRFQKVKVQKLESLEMDDASLKEQIQTVWDKECLCVGLSNAAVKKYGVKPFRKDKAVTICPGPNIAYFSQVVSLKKMIDHIYGRTNIITRERPSVFIKELDLYINYLKGIAGAGKQDTKQQQYIQRFAANLREGIDYYRHLLADNEGMFAVPEKILQALEAAEQRLLEVGQLVE